MNTKTQNPVNKVTKKETTKKVRLENEIVTKGINLLSATKKNTKKDTIKKTKEEIAQKRKLNPQFSHVVSKQKKIDLIEFKSNGLKVLLSTKNVVKNIQIDGYNFAENINIIEKCIGFINFVTKTNKTNDFINNELLTTLLKNVRTTKNGLYNEFYFAQMVQKIVTLSVKKGFDFQTSLNIVIEKNNQAKK
jgi:hypothetical protein